MENSIRLSATASYDADDYWEDSLVLGGMTLLNAFLPMVVWAWKLAPAYANMKSNKVFVYAWYGMQAGHVAAYAITGISWPFIYLKNATFVRALFAYTWTYLGQIIGLSVTAYSVITFLAASYLYTKIGDRDDNGEELL